VFDLLGQLWLIPAQGGKARPITNAVRDIAEDLDPSFSPDGRRVVFRGERNGRTGIWLLDLDSKVTQQLSQLPNPEGFEGNASWSSDGRTIAFARAVPDLANRRWRSDVLLFDVAGGTIKELSIAGIQNPQVRDPVWVHDGRAIAFVASSARGKAGGRVWIVAAGGGQASPLTGESTQAIAPAFSADGQRMAYFAPDSSGRMQVWVQQMSAADTAVGAPLQVTNHADVTPTRMRWFKDGRALLYSADGRLWKVDASGGQPREIPFTAELSITRSRRVLPSAHFPEPGHQEPARGFMGLALSPDGHQIGMLALGKLWVIPVGGTPRAVATVPFAANSLTWSSAGTEVAWSSGSADETDLFATNLATGVTRQVTSLAGRELYPAYSPDGHHLAFVHAQNDGGVLRTIDSNTSNVNDIRQTRELGSIGLNWTSPPQWSPDSDGLLVSGEAYATESPQATFIPLSGQRQEVKRFPDAPIFLQWTTAHTIVFVRHDRLWQVPFDHTGMLAEP
jgi:Tol biopolymer transport system component